MDKPAGDLRADLERATVHKTYCLEELCREYRSLDYLTPEPAQIVHSLSIFAKKLREELLKKVELPKALEEELSLAKLRGTGVLITQVTADLRYVVRATSDRIPGALARLLSERVESLIPGSAIILRPAWHYRYKVHREDLVKRYQDVFRRCLRDETAATDCLAKIEREHLFVVSFPILEKRSIHLHSVLAHELGHILSQQYSVGPAERDQTYEQINQQLVNELSGQKKQPLLFSMPELLEKAKTAWEKGVAEYGADAASVLLLGPSAIFGAADYALARGLGADTSEAGFHPAWGRRLSLMLDLAEKEGWLKVADKATGTFGSAATKVKQRLEQIRQWIGPEPTAWKSNSKAKSIGHALAEQQLPSLVVFLKQVFKDKLPRAEDVLTRQEELFNRFSRGLPPDSLPGAGGHTETPNLEDILLASWWFRLSHQKAPTGKAGADSRAQRDRDERTRRLTMKALENVDVVRRFGGKLADLEREEGEV